MALSQDDDQGETQEAVIQNEAPGHLLICILHPSLLCIDSANRISLANKFQTDITKRSNKNYEFNLNDNEQQASAENLLAQPPWNYSMARPIRTMDKPPTAKGSWTFKNFSL